MTFSTFSSAFWTKLLYTVSTILLNIHPTNRSSHPPCLRSRIPSSGRIDWRCDCDGIVMEAYLTKLSSSLFLALIGGSDLSALSPPPMKKAAVVKVVARVAIASCYH